MTLIPGKRQPRLSDVLRGLSLTVVLGLSVTMVGCVSGEKIESPTGTVTVVEARPDQRAGATSPPADTGAPDTPEVYSGSDALAETYLSVIENPANYPVTDSARHTPIGTWSYSFIEATGDTTPELLLRVDSTEFSPVLIFTTGDDPEHLIHSRDVLIEGVSQVSGGRTRLAASHAGSGIYQIDWGSLSREASSARYFLRGTSLTAAGLPQAHPVESSLPDHKEISWYDTTDLRALEALRSSTTMPSATKQVIRPQFPDRDASTTIAEDLRFTGMVVDQSTSEIMKGRPAPNGEAETTGYLNLILEEPMTVSARTTGSGIRTETVSVVSLSRPDSPDNAEQVTPFIGQRVSITTSPASIWFPSDTSIPLGMPRISGIGTIQAHP